MNFESLYNPVDGKIEDAQEDFENLPSAADGSFVPSKPEPGLFDGMSETWKAPISGAIKTTAAFETALAETNVVGSALQMHETETGEAIADPEEREKQITARLEEEAREHRELAQNEYGLDPETSGFAAQMVFGLAETLPKAIGYSILGGPIGGAVGFGADVGLTTYGELRDKGVDKGTAAVAGLTSGAFNAVGVWLPATFGKSRTASATIGALANFGLTGAELAGVSFALATQDYDDLAEQYGLNWTALATSAVFGGVFGGAMYRSRGNASRFDEAQRKTVNESIYEQLKAAGGVYADDMVARSQADLHATAVENISRVYDVPFESVEAVLPRIVREDGSLDSNAFAMQEYEKKLATEVETWSGAIDALEAKPTQPLLMLTQTPLAMKLVGAEFREVRADPHVFDGMFPNTKRVNKNHNVHEEMTAEVLKNIPTALADPIAVFKDDRRGDSFVFMLDIQAKGKTVVTAVRFEASGLRGKLNLVKTAFGKNDPLWFDLQPNNSTVVYVNEQKAKRWELTSGSNSLRAPNADGSSVLTEKDLVKLREEYPGFYQKDQSVNVSSIPDESLIKKAKENLGSYNPATREIKLTPKANLSTFSHEMGHWYLDTMIGMSGRGSALLTQDIDTLLREFGVKSVEDWNGLGVEGQRKYHEQFASWLEVYLSKGEAPNPSLKDVLARVAQWIVDVYERFGGTKQAVEGRFESEFGTKLPEMSDEVKAVMDRLFVENKANKDASKMKATPDQVAASRVVLDDFVRNEQLGRLVEKVDNGKKLTKEEQDYWNASLRAMRIAEQGLNEGKPVDVSSELRDVPLDEKAVTEALGKLARELGDIKPKQREAQVEVEQGVVSETDRVIQNVEDALVQIKDADGNPLLDAGAVHEELSMVKLAIDAVNDARALNEQFTAQTNTLEAKRESARAVFGEDGQQVMLHNIGQEMPAQTYRIQDANGNVVDMTIADIEAEQARLLEQAETDQAAMGKAIECILNNQGI